MNSCLRWGRTSHRFPKVRIGVTSRFQQITMFIGQATTVRRSKPNLLPTLLPTSMLSTFPNSALLICLVFRLSILQHLPLRPSQACLPTMEASLIRAIRRRIVHGLACDLPVCTQGLMITLVAMRQALGPVRPRVLICRRLLCRLVTCTLLRLTLRPRWDRALLRQGCIRVVHRQALGPPLGQPHRSRVAAQKAREHAHPRP